MSTVADILTLLQYHRDVHIDPLALIPITNRAIGTIAQQLYVDESDLITDTMEVDIFSEQAYTASMAFVDGGASADTITDGAAQFVVEAFAAGMPITTTQASNPGPFRIATVAAGTLTLATSDVVVAAGAGSFAITSDDAYGFLPSDFWGLNNRHKPYLSGYTTPLLPLPSTEVELQYPGAGLPLYYRIIGTSKIYVTPHAGANYTIKADYFQKPTAMTVNTDTLPYNEMFDDLIIEYVARYFRGGEDLNERMLLDKDIKAQVSIMASKYGHKAPPQSSGINWNAESEGW